MSMEAGNFSRRKFLGSAALFTTGLLWNTRALHAKGLFLDVSKLPVSFPHFPGKLHAFVWRNWTLAPLDRIAKVAGTSEAQISKLAEAIGLPPHQPISDEQWSRSYITIIRRNWHLLPKSQLIELLGWTEDHFEFTLQEDDFLNVKLGNLKPECEPIRWSASNDQDKKAEAWFRRTVNKEFPLTGNKGPKEPLFAFVRELSEPPVDKATPLKSGFVPRYGYGYFTLFGDPLLDQKIDPYPDGYLERMAASGLDGTWIHIVLSKITPFPWNPSISTHWEKRLENLVKLVEKCKRHGLGAWLYLNEPRYQPLAFYEKYPELKGVTRGGAASLCTSHPEVQKYLTESIEKVVAVVPDLAGFFSITASENPTNCWSHGQGADCPRCGPLGPEKVIAKLNSIYEQGIRNGLKAYEKRTGTQIKGEGPRLVAWDWGWRDGWADGIVAGLPENASLMSVSEWDLPIKRGGIDGKVGEYSISAVGPGPRAKRHWEVAKKRNLRILAKIQAGTTWECGGVPYVPAVENVAQHAYNLRELKVSGLMTGWTLGGYPGSPNLEVVSVVGSEPEISVDAAMHKVANRRYGAAAKEMVKAWYGFSKAYREFPYHIGVVYSAPVHSGPANLLWDKPTGYTATMVGIGYDDLKSWRSIYPEEVFIDQLYKVAGGFESSLKTLRDQTVKMKLTTEQRHELNREMSVAEAVAVLYRSVANQSDFIRNRDQLSRAQSAEKQQIKSRIKALLNDEIKLAHRLYQLQTADSRIGFEATNHYFYIPADLQEKVLNCRYLLEQWIDKA